MWKVKAISRLSPSLHVLMTTVANIPKIEIHGTVANNHECGRRRKIDDKSKRRIKQMVTKEPRNTSREKGREGEGELQAQGTSASDRTVHHCWSQSGLNGRGPRRRPLLKTDHKKPDWNLPKYTLTLHKASGRTSYEQRRQKWTFLPRHISSMFTDGKMKHFKKGTLSLL